MHSLERTTDFGGDAQRLLDALLITKAREEVPFDGFMLTLVARPYELQDDWDEDLTFTTGVAHEVELHHAFVSAVFAMFDPPGDAQVAVDASGWLADPGFRITVSYDEETDRLSLEFDDGSELVSVGAQSLGPTEDHWATAVVSGTAQARLEAIVALATRAELLDALSDEESRIGEAVLALLSVSATSQQPDRALVRSGLMWLGRKVDPFVDEAAKTGGKFLGAGVAGGAGIALASRFPELAHRIGQLLEITGT